MATRLYGILTDGLNKPIVNATVALLAKGNTITVLNGSEAVFRTDGEGAYNITVQAGHYKVIIGPQGLEPYKAGEIVIYSDSPEGSLNGYLINWAPEELTPDVIKQVQQLVANSEEYALQAGRSAAAANADATDARNSKASAAQSSSDALVYKNDAKASEDAAKQAQAGAAGSANTASQAVTTIQGLKSDVEQLKTDTQGIKDSAVTETTALKDAAAASAAQASNSATEAGQQASNAAGSAQSASTDAERAEVAAGKAEGVLSQALLKDNNLSDVSDLDITRSNLKVDKLVQETEHTFLYTDDKRYRLSIGSGEIVFQHDTDGQNNWTTVPFPVDIGGTGASTASEARTNLDVPANNEALLVENNLQDLADRAAAWLNVRPQGSTPLAGDPVGDYDAATKRWVENFINSGTVGPTMNGVMNYGVGIPVPWVSRAYIPPYLQPLDGQLLEREKFPDLWSHAQQHGVISDAAWLADPTKRGSYSDGDGQTTFRVPDWNGVQDGSIPGVFFRGGGSSATDKSIALNAAPNIKGTVSPMYPNVSHIPLENLGGAITNIAIETNGYSYPGNVVPGVSFRRGIQFDASLYHSSYGRDGATEVVPNRVSGVWCVRANGSFVAANTSWNVINGDKTAPSIGTNIKGGDIRSDYNIAGSMHLRSSMRADGNYGQRGGGVWRVEDSSGNKSEITFNLGGEFVIPAYTRGVGSGFIASSKRGEDSLWPVASPQFICELTGRAGNPGTQGATFSIFLAENVGVDSYGVLNFSGAGTSKDWLFNQFGNAIAPGSWLSNSDRRIKKDIARIEDPLDKMRKIHGYSWRKLEGNQFGVGFIAQEVQELFPESVYEGPSRTMPDGTVVEGVLSPDTSGVAAALHHEAILALMDQIEELKQEIAVLKASMQTLP